MPDLEPPGPLPKRQFASDNYAGVCPAAWAAMERANAGHAVGYGDDAWTKRACDLIRNVFEIDCQVFFTFNGTAANALVLASLCRSYHSVICHRHAHVEVDECGAPEFFSNGTKVLVVEGEAGKVDCEAVTRCAKRRSDIHYPKPKVLSLTQATELGTVYDTSELDAVSETARRLGLRVHMDGARFANAVASLGVSPKEVTWKAGVDVLCFGGTKNGMAVGDAVVFFDNDLAAEFDYRCKQAGQLASKMRFLAAPWVGMLEDDVWLNNARHANAMAELLEAELRKLPDDVGVEVTTPRQANAVFARIPSVIDSAMRGERGWCYYDFYGPAGARLMCAWDTTERDVTDFVRDLRQVAGVAGS